MKKIVLIIAYVLNVSIGICGGVIVTQGDCCGGGSQNNQAQLNVRALNMLSTIDDTTVIDGGDADRNTYKNLGVNSYRLNYTGSGTRTFGIRDTLFGFLPYDGINYIGGEKVLLNGIVDLNDTTIAILAQGNVNTSLIFIDSNILTIENNDYISRINSIYMNNQYNPNNITISAVRTDLDKNIVMNLGNGLYDLQVNRPILTGNYDAYTDYAQTDEYIRLEYDRANSPVIPGLRAAISIENNVGNTYIDLKTDGGEYNLNTSGRHYFTSSLPTTASFNGDIEATAFNIISDRNMKDNIKEVDKPLGLLGLGVYTYNYDAIIKIDTIYGYDTLGFKDIKKTLKDSTIIYKEPILKKYIKDITKTQIKQPNQYGLMAQELEVIAPECVSDNGTYKSIDYAQLVSLLILEVRDLRKELDDLKK